MNLVSYSPDKFGYYTVGDYKTYSKLEAIEIQNRTNQFPEWHFNHEAYAKINWKTPIQFDIWDLYKIRAQQIRNSYDYVVLFYSGGSDSYNAISAWIDSGLKIDEIATFWNYEGSKNKFDLMNSEPTMVVEKQIDLWKLQTDFKFRLIDFTQISLDSVNTEEDFVYSINNSFSPNNTAKAFFRDKVEDWKRIIDSGKKLCLVWGSDKPQFFYDDGHYIQFFDIIDHCVSPHNQRRYYQGYYDELFYWTPDMPEIVVKQCQIVKNFISVCNDPQFYQTEKNTFGYNPQLKMYLTGKTFRNLIYPTWNVNTFSSGKSPNKVFSLRDQWLWDSNLEERQKVIDRTLYYRKIVGDYWHNDPNDISKGLKRHASPRYYI